MGEISNLAAVKFGAIVFVVVWSQEHGVILQLSWLIKRVFMCCLYLSTPPHKIECVYLRVHWQKQKHLLKLLKSFQSHVKIWGKLVKAVRHFNYELFVQNAQNFFSQKHKFMHETHEFFWMKTKKTEYMHAFYL